MTNGISGETPSIIDPSDLSVSVALAELRRNPGAQVSPAAWERVREKLPHLRRFIEGASYQIAPENHVERGNISAALVGVVDLLFRAESQAEFDERWQELMQNDSSFYAGMWST
jgi:DNA-binding GntR family transcriptional regulator